jgi:hypothetical protein
MKTIEAYQTSDGQVFTDDRKAKAHQDDLIGQEIDELVRVLGLDVGFSQLHKAALNVVNNADDNE